MCEIGEVQETLVEDILFELLRILYICRIATLLRNSSTRSYYSCQINPRAVHIKKIQSKLTALGDSYYICEYRYDVISQGNMRIKHEEKTNNSAFDESHSDEVGRNK